MTNSEIMLRVKAAQEVCIDIIQDSRANGTMQLAARNALDKLIVIHQEAYDGWMEEARAKPFRTGSYGD